MGGTVRSAVSLSGVTKTFGQGAVRVAALDGVDLHFDTGSFTAVMGPSGSGKSTLLMVAAGLEQPTAGAVAIGDAELGGLSERRLTELRRARVGFVFQSFQLIDSLTAEQNVALPLRLAGRRPKRAVVRALLDAVGLADRAGHLPSQLSGGQQQRVAIARALAPSPAVIFADEPTGALDSRTGREVLALLRALVAEQGQTVVMVTHDPVAASYAESVLFLADGRVRGRLAEPTAATVAARMTALEEAKAR